ncbi:protein EIN4-like [Malania oleifera]|uniref:protein EIN4-like n=1 Tax=Malania oleifera TaxID=397392 RepID=UPI0025AE1269|nr:protein EIN4-like [Malania oleifera]
MLRTLAPGLLFSSLLISLSAAENGFPRCNCDDDGYWSADGILECQRVSDFLIAVAYFSIPIELLYFVSCSNVPFKWVLFEFIAFIVLCGLTHLLNGWTYGPHTFQLMLALTIFKFLTALVSCATAITLITLIPLLLKVKVREFMLKKKAWDLGREVGLIRQQKEAGWHVRMLTQEIRKSLDRHTILYTTMVELSKTLDLQSCAIWMPNEIKTEMILTHELKGRNFSNFTKLSIPISNPDVQMIKGSDSVNILRSDSILVTSCGGSQEPGPVAAIRMPMLPFSNFKGGTPELIQTFYAILILVLPGGQDRYWNNHELEIVKVVADQVAVALSHAAVLEESQYMREKLAEQNRALQQAKRNAMMASRARITFQKVMSDGMRRPMHSVLGLLSMIQDGNLSNEQRMIVDTMMKSSFVLSTLINDVMDTSTKDNGRIPLEMKQFHLHSMIKEVACLAKCLCIYKGYGFAVEVEKSLPDHVMGDERRVFQLILHMVGSLLNGGITGGFVMFRVFSDSGSEGNNDQGWATWRPCLSDGYVNIKFEIRMNNGGSQLEVSGRGTNDRVEEGLSFSVCKKLAQLMQGNIWVVPNPQGYAQSITLVLRFQLQPFIRIGIPESGNSSDHPHSDSLFKGLKILLADDDDVNRAVTRKLLEKLGCTVSAVSTGFECLSALGPSFQVVLLDLHMPEMDGYEVARRIRKFRSRSWPLLIVLTASTDEDICEVCLQIGINGVIRKPVLIQGIADELRRVLLHANQIVL